MLVNSANKRARFIVSKAGQKALLISAQSYLSRLSDSARAEAFAILDELVDNWEAVTILTFAGIGISSTIGDVAMTTKLPMFIEKKMVIPVVASIIVLLLTGSMYRKAQKRRANARLDN